MIFLGINPSAIFMPSCIGLESCIRSSALRSLTTSPHKKSTAHLGHRPETGKTFSSKCPSDSKQRSARQEAKFKKLSIIIKYKKTMEMRTTNFKCWTSQSLYYLQITNYLQRNTFLILKKPGGLKIYKLHNFLTLCMHSTQSESTPMIFALFHKPISCEEVGSSCG